MGIAIRPRNSKTCLISLRTRQWIFRAKNKRSSRRSLCWLCASRYFIHRDRLSAFISHSFALISRGLNNDYLFEFNLNSIDLSSFLSIVATLST
eukprot:scaffold504891_cov38-Prasinocladus_malaysianus.AAC.2